MADIPQVVILGAGFGGIGALKKLRDAGVRITLIDKHDYHSFQPLLYQVATLELAPEQVGFPIRNLLHNHENLTFHQSVVTSIDPAGKQVITDSMAKRNRLAPSDYERSWRETLTEYRVSLESIRSEPNGCPRDAGF